MEKPSPPPSPSSTTNGSMEPKCIGRLEIARPKPVGFLCGSIPVPTDNSFHAFNSALVPSRETVSAPRYRMLPTETDLNTLPVVANLPEKVLPISAVRSRTTGELAWDVDAVASNLTKKCEALAVTGLAEYGDEIDVIAPADILKQIFKMPYSKARLSIAVRRVGQTLILNTGPDAEEGEKLVRRHKNQSKCADQSLFLNFAMHSVRMEACDCPPMHHPTSEEQLKSSVLPGACTSHFAGQRDDTPVDEEYSNFSESPQAKADGYFWKSKNNKKNKDHQPVKKTSLVGEKPRSSVQESEKRKRISNNGFLRVLFWQFHNFRMLLGSDLLLFSNEKYVAVSLHLWDVTRQVTPLTWLDAWLDNVMASVPELAICYHENGVVQGYELLKTDDIFLLKGISEDGTPAFHPHVVQQNGLTVLRFLQENCTQDPGAYWLYKSAGEDVLQLFDLSIIPKSHTTNNCDDIESSSALPSLLHTGRSNSLFSLGTLLYRIAHRLSLSMESNDRAKCVRFFRKCLEFLDEPDNLVVRACAHEQYARLLLSYDDELELTFPSESLSMESEVTVPMESLDSSSISESAAAITLPRISESAAYENLSSSVLEDRLSEDGISCYNMALEPAVKMNLEAHVSDSRNLIDSCETESNSLEESLPISIGDERSSLCKMSPASPCVVETVADPISSKLAAVHHVSQAIKSLRWMRQLQGTEMELLDEEGDISDRPHSSIDFSLCACGDVDCIEVCDIREWLPTSKIDHKLWKLVLLLGESYLALGQAYKEDNQLHQTLKVVELACTVYGSMPQHLEDTRFFSSMIKYPPGTECNDKSKKAISYVGDSEEVKSSYTDKSLALERISSTSLFWARAWTLVGDVYVEFHVLRSKEVSTQSDRKSSAKGLRVSSEVVKEVQRLKTKLGQFVQNCSSCSLVNCSCQSDRASSGSSASCSTGNKHSAVHGRKHGKRSHVKSASYLSNGESDIGFTRHRMQDKSPNNEFIHLDCNSDTPTEVSDINSNNGDGVGQGTNEDKSKVRSGGIFRYVRDPVVGDAEKNLSSALSCYEEAKTALVGVSAASAELQSIVKKIGWVCNELGRDRLQRKELTNAELAFSDAIAAFGEVSDHSNIILINCNLGHGRRALAEELIAKYESLKSHALFQDACKQALEAAKTEYGHSLRFYGAAKAELNAITKEESSVSNNFKNEVYTQFAHTYLRLGMLLARGDLTAQVNEHGALKPGDRRGRREVRKQEISANDAIREALSMYETLGDLRKQEAAFAYFQLASYQRDTCLKFLESDLKRSNFSKSENSVLHRVKQYASLAERNWQKAIEFYGPTTHPSMYINILTQRSALTLSLCCALHSHTMLESALSQLLKGRYISETISDSFASDYPEIHARFWERLQTVLKKMLATVVSANTNRSSAGFQLTSSSNKPYAGKLRELYKMSLKSTHFSQLHAMHTLWTS